MFCQVFLYLFLPLLSFWLGREPHEKAVGSIYSEVSVDLLNFKEEITSFEIQEE
jgi:hypothetical protein